MSRTTRAKACWSFELRGQAVEIGAGLLLDPVAPERNQLLAALGRRPAGQLLAHHQRHGFLERRVGLLAHVGEIGLGVFVLEHLGDVVGHAGHGPAADRLDAGLLDGVEHGAGLLAFGRQPGVDAVVVAGALQRHGIAKAARDRDVGLRRPSSAARAAAPGCRPAPAGPWRRRPRARCRRKWHACRR